MAKPSRRSSSILAGLLGAAILAPAAASAAPPPPPPNLVYVPLTPCRMVNTGIGAGILVAGTPQTFFFRDPTRNYTSQGGNASGCGIPSMTGGGNSINIARAIAVNIFAVSPVGDGDIRAWPSNQAVPLAAVLTYAHVGTLAFANGVILTMCDQVGATACASGDVTFRADFGNTNLIVDVVGYFTEGSTLTTDTNVALGHKALAANTTGISPTGTENTAIGKAALQSNIQGYLNTATGFYALALNTFGAGNTATGGYALQSTQSANANTAFGANALKLATGSLSTAVGANALRNDTTGFQNTALGYKAGSNVTTGSNNIDIGSYGLAVDNNTMRLGLGQSSTFIVGVRGVTTAANDAIPVLISSTGQLGTISSSRRFKQDIVDIGDESAPILDLRPVKFRYKEQAARGDESPQFGLIAEEVAEVFPDLVIYGKDGLPETVKYHVLVPLLLNELQKEQRQIDALRSEVEAQRAATTALLRRVESLQAPSPRARARHVG